MKILITGGAGYLGSVLVHRFIFDRPQDDVVVLDSFRHGVPSLALIGGNASLEIDQCDIVRQTGKLHRLMSEADAVIHLAALVGAPACAANENEAFILNEVCTVQMVKDMRPDQPLIFPCTNSGYGKGGDQPVTENDSMTPLSLYGRTKVAAERAVLSHPLGVSLRFATLYGQSPRMRLDLLVNDFVHRASMSETVMLYEPHFRRCVLNVSDAANAVLAALDNASFIAARPWNVGAENITKGELCERIQRQVPRFDFQVAPGNDPDQRDYEVSSDQFRLRTGWEPQIDLDRGIAALLRLFKMPFDGSAWRNA